MARGKEAVASMRRQLDAAYAHIDRLTDELVDAKTRARQAETTAQRVEQVEQLLRDHNNDDLLAKCIDRLKRWKQIAKQDRDRRGEAWREINAKLLPDLRLMGGWLDQRELFLTRYPALSTALMAGDDVTDVVGRGALPSSVRHLSDADCRRLQHVVGQRAGLHGDPQHDFVSTMNDLLDAKQLDFSPREILEVVGLKDYADRVKDKVMRSG